MTMPEGQGPPPGGYPSSVPTGPAPSYPPPSGPAYPPPGGPAYPAPSGPSYPPPGGPGFPAPGGAGYLPAPSAPPARSSGRRTGVVILAVLVVIILAIVGALAFFRDSTSGDVNALQVGDCIDQPLGGEQITQVQHQPCNQPHDGEVFALLTYPAASDATYPGEQAFSDYVDQECLPQVQLYTGRTLEEIDAAGLSYAWFYPSTSSWTDSNDRGITCYLARSDQQKMTGSVKTGVAPSHSP